MGTYFVIMILQELNIFNLYKYNFIMSRTRKIPLSKFCINYHRKQHYPTSFYLPKVQTRQNSYKNWSRKCWKITLVNDRRSLNNADPKFGLPRKTNKEICYMPKELRKDSYLKVFEEGLSTNNINSFPWQPMKFVL